MARLILTILFTTTLPFQIGAYHLAYLLKMEDCEDMPTPGELLTQLFKFATTGEITT